MIKKFRWWLDSVRGLHTHINVYRHMLKALEKIPVNQRHPEIMKSLDQQAAMIGNCLLHVILVHPIGSGRFFED